ncbi:tRNA (N(6)-L-threonylcarbamoyladenosine(37)-C(2))-methylthiotransferase MtaB [Eubacterium sp. 1001713B170207_170306_E7]|uniref:tRNA (N(6)-L-threonylcarbamoyladenosine(37)-C(2))- methylthiotransferase MtaB n=1 Tax=Eubacterium sp. 1001713B170207_170306_E7 TaxID=2787097 RepID=UPI001A9A9C63|nr:tRNA (N(6)-L-threonylcarbamoyladenosine(37)-C(2))-methylthiotransferase MtaB [Eubacterium sp. 1001713B170207_170306_E7]
MNNQKTVAFHTLGCKVNAYDTEAMMEIFEKAGYRVAAFTEYADVYVINTCTVTHLGDRKSRNMMRKARRMNPDAVIVAVGCYVQVAPGEVAAIEEVDLIIGTKNRADIVDDIEAYRRDKTQNSFVSDIMREHDYEDLNITETKGRTRAFLKVQEGCSQFCTYCIVPFARGPVRSRPVASVLEEVKRVAARGYAEVVLTGIHIASYGIDLEDGVDLLSLIRAVSKIEGVKRIRLGSLEPLLLTEEFVRGLAEIKAFCPHFHLSLQSGCDTVLSRMGRRYTTGQYAQIVARVRRYFDYPAITTDIMVGFPGETEAEFETTLAFVKQIGFYQVHVFKYSRRRGTKADLFPDQVPEDTKTERSHRLTRIARACEQDFLAANAGRTVPVLFERAKEEGVYEGHTDNYIPVVLKATEKINGKIIETELLYKESEFHMTGLLN